MPFRRIFYPDLIVPVAGGGSFDPVTEFFSASEDGFLTDIQDLGTLWQNTDGTGAVTAVNDPVKRIDDISGNANHLVAQLGASGTLKQDGNSKYYIDTSSGVHFAFTTALTNIRSVTVVFEDISNADYVPLIGDATAFDWHGNTGGNMIDNAFAAANVYNGEWKLNLSTITPSTTVWPTTPKVISVRTLGNVSGSQTRDRNFGGRELDGKIYSMFINSADIGSAKMIDMINYLKDKHSLTF